MEITRKLEKYRFDVSLPIFLYVIMIILVWPLGSFPLNDDWVYTKDVMNLHFGGTYSTTGLEAAWGVPQVLLGALIANIFGFSIVSLRCVNIIATVGIILILHQLLRRITSSVLKRLFLLLSFSLYAPVLLIGFSFMTDVLFLLFWLISCLFFERYFSGKRSADLCFAVIFCFLATIQRQFGLALILTNLIMAMFYFPVSSLMKKKEFIKYYFGILIYFLLIFAVQQWWQTIDSTKAILNIPVFGVRTVKIFIEFQYITILYMALALVPFSGFLLPARNKIKQLSIETIPYKTIFFATTVVMFVLFHWHFGRYMPYLGNQISAFGVFNEREVLNGVRPVLLNGYLGIIMTIVCLIVTVLMIFPLSRYAGNLVSFFKIRAVFPTPSPDNKYPWGAFTFFSAIIYLLILSIRMEIFDRYLTIIIPAALLALAGINVPINARRIVVSTIAAIFVFFLSFAYVNDYFRWNEAKWDATYFALNNKIHYQALEAGYEYNGFYSRTPLSHHTKTPEYYPFVVSYSPLESFIVIRKFPYKTIFPPYNQAIYLLQNKQLKQKK